MDLRIEKLSFGYKGRSVLQDISFETQAGTVTVVLGPNAVGKSTLLKCIVGILKARGTIFLGENRTTGLSRKKAASILGYLAQEQASNALLNVFEMVLLGRMESFSLRISPQELETVWKIMREMRIDDIATRFFHQLSGGQRKIVLVAQTLVREPQILLLDEPTANLDIQNQLEMVQLIQNYTRQNRIATVMTLHDLNIAARFADQLVVLKEGRVYCIGTPQEVLTKQVMREVYGVDAEFFQDSRGIPVVHPVN